MTDIRMGHGKLYVAPADTPPPPVEGEWWEERTDPGAPHPAPITRPICHRHQEVYETAPGGLRFSCECGGEGCPDQPGRRPWLNVGQLAPGQLVFDPLPVPQWTFAAREAFERIGRGFQALNVSVRTAGLAFERIRRALFGADAPRSPYVRKIRQDYRRKSRARTRRGRR